MPRIDPKFTVGILLIALNATAQAEVSANETSNAGRGDINAQPRALSQKEAQTNEDTAKAANKVDGVNLQGKDLQPPAQEVPIRGFHPIKKMLQPVVRLEKNSVQLEQQIMKLEGPIAGLQPAMLTLHKNMGSVEKKMGAMQSHIEDVGKHIDDVGVRVNDVGSQMRGISTQMTAVRSDITGVRKEIGVLEGPIKDLHKPLAEVARPLLNVEQKIDNLAALLTTVLFAILLAAGIIAIGTPVAAILIYRNRRKLFPDMKDGDFPVAKPGDRQPTLHASKT